MRNGRYKHVARLNATSIHHITHTIVTAQDPHAGTHMYTVKLTSVVKPMGKVLVNSDCTGWWIIFVNFQGQIAYRAIVMVRK